MLISFSLLPPFLLFLVSRIWALRDLLQAIYERPMLSTSQHPFVANADASKSVSFNVNTAIISGFHTFIKRRQGKAMERSGGTSNNTSVGL